MKTNNFNKVFSVIISFLLVSFIMQSCKKDKATPDNSKNSKYFISATVNGKDWKSDTTDGGDFNGQMAVLGLKVVNSDSTIFILEFPDNVSINQSIKFDQNQNNILIYALQSATDPNTATIYETDQSVGGSGNFTVTKLDKTALMVEGIFSGIGVNNKNANDQIMITNGKFSLPFVIGKQPDDKFKLTGNSNSHNTNKG